MGLSADPPVGAPAGRVQLGTAWGSAVAAPPASFRRATAVASLPAGHGCGLAGGRGAVRDVVCSAFRRRPAGTGGGGDGCRGRGGRLAGLRVPGLPPALAMVAALTSWWVISVLLWGLLVALLVLRRFRYLFVVLIAWTLQGVLIQYPAAASPPSYAPPATRPPASPATQAIDTGTDEQSVDPGVEPVGVAQPRQVPPGADQGFLDRVSRELAIPEDEPGCRVQPRDSRAGKHREGVMIAPLRLFDETSLVHRRLSSSAAFRCAQMVCRADASKGSRSRGRGPLPGSLTNTNEARHPEGSDTAGVPMARGVVWRLSVDAALC